MQGNNDNISTEEFHKEIDLIQSCITRMAQNSFIIKGWGFGIVAALVALTADKMSPWVISIIGCFILLFFWYLDAFFLTQEKLYRIKYEWVIDERPKGNRTFLYDLNPYNISMWKPVINPKNKKSEPRKMPLVVSVMFSRPCTLLLFYGSAIFASIVIIILSVFGVIKP